MVLYDYICLHLSLQYDQQQAPFLPEFAPKCELIGLIPLCTEGASPHRPFHNITVCTLLVLAFSFSFMKTKDKAMNF